MKRFPRPPRLPRPPVPTGHRAKLNTMIAQGHVHLRANSSPRRARKGSGPRISVPLNRVGGQSRSPYADLWRTASIPRERDIRRLAPPSAPPNERFETEADVAARKKKLIKALRRHEPGIADALQKCALSASRCLTPGCPECSRLYRGYLFSETMRTSELLRGRSRDFVTVYLATIPTGSLAKVSIQQEHAKFRRRLRQLGFHGSLLIGGTEVAWINAKKIWILHLHILAIGVDPAAWERLRERLANTGPAIPLKRDPVRAVTRQLSYLQKWLTLHRPGRQFGAKRATAYPLKERRVAEICRWWANHRFEDFTFLFGARRRGGRIVPEA